MGPAELKSPPSGAVFKKWHTGPKYYPRPSPSMADLSSTLASATERNLAKLPPFHGGPTWLPLGCKTDPARAKTPLFTQIIVGLGNRFQGTSRPGCAANGRLASGGNKGLDGGKF